MVYKVPTRLLHLFFILLIVALACNAPSATATISPTAIPGQLQTALPAATATATLPVTHLTQPIDISLTGTINYDVVSQDTASQHRAPYGDSYQLNLFERPFTQMDMTYLPNVDINQFRISQDSTWNYIFINLIGNNPNDPIGIDYGVEISKSKDGFGDTLIWAHPPYTTTWSTDPVKVYTDPNHDTGGASASKSDALPGVPYPGDGYETIIFNGGQGSDPDLAWVRIDPADPTLVEFAFKQSLSGPAFMWGVWADAGLKDPSKFDYNDRFTPAEAGSPISGDPNYPIKAIYAVDNTCWVATGFKPTGFEPKLCPPITQPVVKVKSTSVPGLHGVVVGVCYTKPYCANNGLTWVPPCSCGVKIKP